MDIKIRVGASLDANAARVFDPIEKAAQKAAREAQKAALATQREWEKAAKKMAADQAKADRQVAAENEKRLREEQKVSREIVRANKEKVREEERAERQLTQSVAREVRERMRLQRQADREVERDLAKSNRERERQRKALEGGGAIGVGRRAGIRVPRPVAIGYGYGGAAIGLGRDLLEGVGVETGLAPHLAHAMAQEGLASDIVSAGYIPGAVGKQGIRQNPEEILAQTRQVANATATETSDVLGGLRKFVALTGDLETGRESLMGLARLAKATGSDFGEMATSAAEVSNHLGDIPDKAKVTESVMRVIAGQGKLGAVEVKDLARQMAKIAASAPKFEGGTAAVIGELGLLAQESKLRGGSATAPQAATAVMAFARDLAKPTTLKHWKAAGLSPYTDKSETTLRSPEELILEAIHFSKGSLPKLATLFPNAMSMRAVQGFASIYSETKGTDADKLRAVNQEFDRLRKAQLDETEVSRAFAAAMGKTQSKVTQANNRLDEMASKIVDSMLPALAGLAPALEALTPVAAGLIDKFTGLLGINPNEDRDARNRRVQLDNINAAEKDLQLAAGGRGGQKLVYNPQAGGFTASAGEIDQAHIDQLKEDKAKRAGEIAAKKAELAKYTDEVTHMNRGNRLGLPETNVPSAEAQKEIRRQQAQIDQQVDMQAKAVDVLERIEGALTSGKIRASVPPAPVSANPSGQMPAESEGP